MEKTETFKEKLIRHLEDSRYGRNRKWEPSPMRPYRAHEDIRQTPVMEFNDMREHLLEVVFGYRQYVRDSSELRHVRKDALRAILNLVYGDIKPLLYEADYLVRNGDIRKASELINEALEGMSCET